MKEKEIEYMCGELVGAAIGWMYSYAYNELDNERDLRKQEVFEILEQIPSSLKEKIEELIKAILAKAKEK